MHKTKYLREIARELAKDELDNANRLSVTNANDMDELGLSHDEVVHVHDLTLRARPALPGDTIITNDDEEN